MRTVEQDPTALSPRNAEQSDFAVPNDLGSSSYRRPSAERASSDEGRDSSSKIGPYEVGPLIGRGGMGEVFAGFDPRLERPVAIKRVTAGTARADEEFLTEARHAARLSHPGIVRLYDVVQLTPANYIISELVDGSSLNEILELHESRQLPLERALEIAASIADALAYAHENAVVHRDIKAANVLVSRSGEIKLADFGVSATIRGLGPPAERSPLDVLSGTVHAMSPEQSVGDYTDARSDLFSLGSLIYELTTGVSPFMSSDPATSLSLVRELRPLPTAELRTEIPAQLSMLVERLLEKRREDRPESAREVHAVLSAVLQTIRTNRESASPGAPTERQLAVGCLKLRSGNLSGVMRLRVFEVLHDAVLQAGGTLLSSAGPHALFLIGYPTAHENNCEVAIKLLLNVVSRKEFPATICAGGVDCGIVTTVDRAQRVLACGDPIDSASWLAQEAEPGSVTVTLTSQNLARRFFRFAPWNASAQPGRTNLPTYRVTDVSSPDAGIEQVTSTPLRARDKHLELLDRAFQDAQHGLVITRLLVGDAGVGKSRLLHEWRTRRWSAVDLMFTAYATAHEQCSPFAPLKRMWSVWLGLRAHDTVETQRTRFEQALAGFDDPKLKSTLAYVCEIPEDDNPLLDMPSERRRQQIIDVFVALAVEVARERTVVICFEDLHFVDRSTLEVLRRLAESPQRARLLLLLTTRPEFLGSWAVVERLAQIKIERLSANDALLMIESLASTSPLPANTIRKLIALGDGVPLVLEELTRAVVADSTRVHEDQDFYYPTSLADSVARRIAELGPAKDLARVAAALGRESVLAHLSAIAGVGDEELLSRLRKLNAVGLIHVRELAGERRCIFSHAMIQEAVRSVIPPHEMRELCGRIIDVLERSFVQDVESKPERFAHLYTAAGAFERALELHERASRRAFEQSAQAEASAHLQAALSLLSVGRLGPSVEIERRLRHALGPCLMALEGWSSSLVAENLARSRTLIAEERTELRELWGAWAHGVVTHELEPVAAAIDTIRRLPSSPEQQFVALSTQGVTAFYRGQFGVARPFLEQAVAMLPGADESSSSSHIDLTVARLWGCEFIVSAPLHLAWMEVLCERRQHAERLNRAVEELLRRLSADREQREVRHGLYMRVHLGLTLRDYEYYEYSLLRESRGSLHRLFELAGSQLPYYRTIARIGEARARVAAGDHDAVLQLIDLYRYLKSLSRRPTGHVFLATIISEACLETGALDQAAELIDDATAATALSFGRFYAPEAHRVAAEFHRTRVDFARARESLRAAKSAAIALEAPAETACSFFERRIAAIEQALLQDAAAQ